MLVHFRERIDANSINQINTDMVKKGGEKKEDKEEKKHKIMTKLSETSATAIAITFLVINLIIFTSKKLLWILH